MKQIVKNSFIAGTSLAAIVGLVVAPTFQASAASQTANTVINATVAPVISLTSSGTVAFTMTPATVSESNGSDTVTVNTNNTAGYTLTLKDSDATTSLTSGANTITASSNTYASPNTLTTGNWGYAVAGGNFSATYTSQTDATTSTLKYAGISATAQTLKTTATTASADPTVVWYAAKVDSTKPTGVYTDTVTYTATTN